jgi:hypothetical protein
MQARNRSHHFSFVDTLSAFVKVAGLFLRTFIRRNLTLEIIYGYELETLKIRISLWQ